MVGVLLLCALGVAGLATGVLAATGAVGPGSSNAKTAVTKITVSASEFKFVFSKRSAPIGTVIFTVVNKGKISHDFKIGTKKTATLNPGQSAKLTVKFTKKGRYAYLCTLLGHAAAGMKGLFSVATAPVAPPPVTSTATTTTTAPPPPTGTVGNTATTIQVGMFEYRFDLSQTTVPSGQVTFVITNKGNEVHNFAINGLRSGALLPPGGTETWTVGIPAGGYTYVCEVPVHVDRGMTGFLTVTP
jgi:nitrite reductase (NO-forming)